jgi:HSP20 family protein
MTMFVTTRRHNHNPFVGLQDLQRSFDQLLRELEPQAQRPFAAPAQTARGAAPLRWREQGDHILLQALVPGLKPEDLSLEATAEQLTLRGKRASDAPEGFKPLHQEREPFEFSHTLRLNKPVDPDLIEARLQDGVLTVKLPLRPEAQPRAISVQVG